MDCLTIKIFTSHKHKSYCHITPRQLTGSSLTWAQQKSGFSRTFFLENADRSEETARRDTKEMFSNYCPREFQTPQILGWK